jgi:hypothetical protein
MAHILKTAIQASRLVEQSSGNTVGEKVTIQKGMGIEMGDDVPNATLIVITFNGEKYVTDKALLRRAV